MPATPPAAETSKWRFSLKTLFLWTLLVAVAVWLTSWRMWDLDERLILGSWFLAVTGSIWISRQIGNRGIVLTGLLGGVIPGSVAALYYLISEFVWDYADVEHDAIPYCVVSVGIAGVIGGAFFAAMFTPGGLSALPPSQREDRLRRRLIAFSAAMGTLILAIGTWSFSARTTEWTFRGGLWRPSVSRGIDSVSLCADGSHLLLTTPVRRGELSLKVWKLKPFDDEPVISKLVADEAGTTWTPDGQWLAIAQHLDGQATITLSPARRGGDEVEVVVPAQTDSWDEGTVSFSPDGDMLHFDCHSDSSPSAVSSYRWSVPDWRQMPETTGDHGESADRSQMKRRVAVVELPKDNANEDQKFRVEVWEGRASHPDYSFAPFTDPYPAQLSPDGKQLAIHSSLVDLETSIVRELPGVIQAFLPDNKRVICSRRYGSQYWRGRENTPLPFIRHLWTEGEHSQLLLVDSMTGRTINKSQWIDGVLDEVVVSRNGKVAVTVDWLRILAWEIPGE